MSHLAFHGHVPKHFEGTESAGKLIVIEGADGVGRSTQIVYLREWLEVRGHAVLETGWSRSELVGRTIERAKAGNTLNPLTYTLLYACDFADRLEREILPALRAGFVVLADRYVYTVWARAVVRGIERAWVRELFAFAPVPDLTICLRVDVPTLAQRVLLSSGIDHWEAGKDQAPELDLYDSFMAYQSAVLREFDLMADEFGFQTIDTRRPIESTQALLRERLAEIFPPVDAAS
jgi:dTMP kinase